MSILRQHLTYERGKLSGLVPLKNGGGDLSLDALPGAARRAASTVLGHCRAYIAVELVLPVKPAAAVVLRRNLRHGVNVVGAPKHPQKRRHQRVLGVP